MRWKRSLATHTAAYRSLWYETEGFAEFFFSATPIVEVTELNIAAGPPAQFGVARACARSKTWRESLGVFLGQCRVLLPAGTASQRRAGLSRCRSERARETRANGCVARNVLRPGRSFAP